MPTDEAAYLKAVGEAYRVSAAIIEKVRQGNRNPDDYQDDPEQRNALAARGYFDAFQSVKDSLNDRFRYEVATSLHSSR